MKASIKFRDEQKPILRAKIPLNVLNFPFQSGICAGESKELSLNLATSFDFGPSLKFSYRPNDSKNPFSFIFKTGIGHYGSPNKSPLIMSAEFNLIANQNPNFLIHFKPNFGNFSLKKSHSSGFAKGFGEKLNGDDGDKYGITGFSKGLGDKLSGDGFLNNGYFKVNGAERVAGQLADGVLRGTEVSAWTTLPLRDFALVNLRWGLRVPPQEVDAVVVGKRGGDGIRLPMLVMNKIGIEHVARGDTKGEKVGSGDVAKACLEVKEKLEAIRVENGLLSKALSDLKSDIAAGKMDFMSHKYSGGSSDRRGNGDKKFLEGKGFGGEGNDDLKGLKNA